jgi:hypothetical protein
VVNADRPSSTAEAGDRLEGLSERRVPLGVDGLTLPLRMPAVIRSLDDGRAAAGACSVEMPEPTSEGPVVFPPLLFVRGPQASYLNIASENQARGADPLSVSRIFPFPAKECSPLIGPLDRGADFLGAVLRCEWRGERRGEIELAARLFPEGGEEEIEIETELIEGGARRRTSISRDRDPRASAGRYRLEIEASTPRREDRPDDRAFLRPESQTYLLPTFG